MQKDMSTFPLTYAILHGIRVTRAARPEKSPIKRHFMHVSVFERNIGKRYFVYLYCIMRYTGSPVVCPFRPRSCMQPAADDACAVYERRGARRAPSGTPAGAAAPRSVPAALPQEPCAPPPRSPGKKDRRTPGYMPRERRLHVQKRVLLIRLGKAPGRRGSDAWADRAPERCACWGYSPDPHTEP